ncbi:hypothetical protein [Cellulomonas sp. URHB0016]
MIEDRLGGAVLASRLLRIPLDVALENSRDLDDVDAFFYWEPTRGGGQIIVGHDESVLFGISALSMQQMVEAFAAGRRTDLSLFESG